MARYNDKTNLTIAQLREFSAQLQKTAANIEANCETAAAIGVKELSVSHVKSCHDGIDRFATFAGSVARAVTEATLKAPLGDPSPNAAKKPKPPKKSS